MHEIPVAAYGRYAQITIVRHGVRRADHFYTLVDRNNRQVGRPWSFLRNARKHAAAIARHLDGNNPEALNALGVTLEGTAR